MPPASPRSVRLCRPAAQRIVFCHCNLLQHTARASRDSLPILPCALLWTTREPHTHIHTHVHVQEMIGKIVHTVMFVMIYAFLYVQTKKQKKISSFQSYSIHKSIFMKRMISFFRHIRSYFFSFFSHTICLTLGFMLLLLLPERKRQYQ